MVTKESLLLISFFTVLSVGCATTTPVRPALKEDPKVPAGEILENQFTGIRCPFNVSVPSQWKMTLEFPNFLKELGYDKPSQNDKEQTELYIYNPETKSSIQFDLTPAGRYATFNQAMLLEKEGTNDRQDLKKILDSFEVISKK